MEKELKEAVEEALRDRKRNIGKSNVSEADFLTGAMQMYLILNPESEQNGGWCPPSWVFKIMRGESVVD